MPVYTRDEMMSATEIVRNFSAVLDSIKTNRRDKVAIMRKNKLEAVILPIEEYERIQGENELLEHLKIYKVIKERENTPIADCIEFEKLIADNGLSIDAL